jgi:hypothetical protein
VLRHSRLIDDLKGRPGEVFVQARTFILGGERTDNRFVIFYVSRGAQIVEIVLWDLVCRGSGAGRGTRAILHQGFLCLELSDLGTKVLDLGIFIGFALECRGQLHLQVDNLGTDAGDGVEADRHLGIGLHDAASGFGLLHVVLGLVEFGLLLLQLLLEELLQLMALVFGHGDVEIAEGPQVGIRDFRSLLCITVAHGDDDDRIGTDPERGLAGKYVAGSFVTVGVVDVEQMGAVDDIVGNGTALQQADEDTTWTARREESGQGIVRVALNLRKDGSGGDKLAFQREDISDGDEEDDGSGHDDNPPLGEKHGQDRQQIDTLIA